MSFKILGQKFKRIELICFDSRQKFLNLNFRVYYSTQKNNDVHTPSHLESKWYSLWQKKLKDFNKQVLDIELKLFFLKNFYFFIYF